MKYKIEKLKQAEKEINQLSRVQKKSLLDDFRLIEEKGIEFVKRRHLRDDLFEIKTNDVRSLFKYTDNSIILIGLVYEKRSKKAPENHIETALKRLKGI